ncbi:hypothetical protein [Roseimaritima multifibrata]|uniref:hypothetical protein n=1 Tax=Roseimaritima multifibrata TaxID=1930274 RepID=UPI001C54F131|nr:hypothetical protein [Roseimaritima multifibrata]
MQTFNQSGNVGNHLAAMSDSQLLNARSAALVNCMVTAKPIADLPKSKPPQSILQERV